MREVSLQLTKTVTEYVMVTAVSEEIISIQEDKIGRNIEVVTEFKSAHGESLKRQAHTISGNYYDLIMSANPDFAPGKPENEYREIDLWHVIDLLE